MEEDRHKLKMKIKKNECASIFWERTSVVNQKLNRKDNRVAELG